MDTFSALADPTRRNIIEILAYYGRLPAKDISDKFRISPSAISQHLRVLREAKLVRVEKKAQQRIYQMNPTATMALENWAKQMNKTWNERFNRLDKLLAVQEKGGAK